MIIKVCGMRDPENIREVAVLGIDWIGLIFFAGSPRRIIDNGQSTMAASRIPNCLLPIINCQLKEGHGRHKKFGYRFWRRDYQSHP